MEDNVENPFVEFAQNLESLPNFERLQPAFANEAIALLLNQTEQTLQHLLQNNISWESFARPYFAALEELNAAWGLISHLHSVCDSPEWRDVFHHNLPKITAFFSDLAQNEHFANAWATLKKSKEFAHLSPTQQKIIQDEWRDYQLGGAFLEKNNKARFKKLQEELSALSAKFSENVLDATNAFSLTVQKEDLQGVPPTLQAMWQTDDVYVLNLQMPCYLPIMQYANNRALREKMYRAYVSRASEFTPDFDNSMLMEEILKKRTEEAHLLDFAHFADCSTYTKMAGTFEKAHAFVEDLIKKSHPFAQKDAQELKEFAKNVLKINDLQPWDVAFASEKLKEQRFAFSDEQVRDYFPENQVLSGLFLCVKRLYDIDFVEKKTSVWEKSVRFFELQKNGKAVGFIYLDLFARNNKQAGAWMNELRTRERLPCGKIILPIALIVCNFSFHPQGAFFRFDEILTLFHEMGHALNHLLSQVDEVAVSGIRHVEWDAVELPSQFMENFCWHYDVLKKMSAHKTTHEVLPQDLFDKMRSAKNFQSGLSFVRQLEFALIDLLLHAHFEVSKENIHNLLNAVRQKCAVLPSIQENRFLHSFSHIFSGGYAAGYFSYKWAEVLSSDAFAAFEETGDIFNRAMAMRFLDEILSRGGSRLALECFTAFRGRAPTLDALLKHNAME